MIAKNGIDWTELGFVVHGECPEYKKYNVVIGKNVAFKKSYRDWNRWKNFSNVCEEWLDFANFNEWFGENYYTVGDEIMDLCRNLLNQDNNEFSPNECVFIPRRIMQLITPKNLSKSGLPRGVGYRECSDTYYSTCYKTVDGRPTTKRHSGFKTAEEAFAQYKKDKEDYIKEVAKEYADKLPRKVYRALMKYEVRA